MKIEMSGTDISCDIRELLFNGVRDVAVFSDLALASFWGKGTYESVCALIQRILFTQTLFYNN